MRASLTTSFPFLTALLLAGAAGCAEATSPPGGTPATSTTTAGGVGGGGMGGADGTGGGGGMAGQGGAGGTGGGAECVTPADCPGQDTECQARTCDAGVCGVSNAAAGTPLAAQTPGDCQLAVCDGNGDPTSAADDTDLPADGIECTDDLCTAGAPSNPPSSAGSSCTQGGVACDGMGNCTTPTGPTIHVLRVGDGGAALSGASTPVFIEHRAADGTLLGTLALPTAASGANQPLTLSGTATSEGSLSRSANGLYLTVAGYATAPGLASVATSASAAVNRVVARVDAAGNIDTSTLLNTAFDAGNVRGAASADGTSFWVSGNGAVGTAGVWYIAQGSAGGAQILAAPANVRHTHVFGGQLYASSGSSNYTAVNAIGAGLPTMAGQAAAPLPGMPVTGASPYSFALLDRDPNVAGVDTLYVADDRAVGNGGGVQKWSYNGAAWTLVETFTSGLTTGVRGLAAADAGGSVVVFATTAVASENSVIAFVDTGAANPAGAVIATAGVNTVFRGVAISPN